MAVYNKFNSFTKALAEKVHNLSTDQLVILLSNVSPVASNSVTADLTQISYASLSTRNIVTTSSTQTIGTYKIILSDLVLSATGAVGPFRYVIVANSTATNGELIAWFDYGSAITMSNGETFTIDFDGVNGLFTLG